MNSKNIPIRYILPIMLIVTVKLLCNVFFMNKIGFHLFNHYIVLTQSALLYSLLFALLDLSTIIYGLRTTYIIVILGAIMDGIYSFGVYSTIFFNTPHITGHNFQNTLAIHHLALPTIKLYLGGLIGSTITYFAEIFRAQPKNWWGYVTNGSTESNLYALLLARELHPEGMVYCSSATHCWGRIANKAL